MVKGMPTLGRRVRRHFFVPDRRRRRGLPVRAVQKVAVAVLPAIDPSENERAWAALVARLARGDEHALA